MGRDNINICCNFLSHFEVGLPPRSTMFLNTFQFSPTSVTSRRKLYCQINFCQRRQKLKKKNLILVCNIDGEQFYLGPHRRVDFVEPIKLLLLFAGFWVETQYCTSESFGNKYFSTKISYLYLSAWCWWYIDKKWVYLSVGRQPKSLVGSIYCHKSITVIFITSFIVFLTLWSIFVRYRLFKPY